MQPSSFAAQSNNAMDGFVSAMPGGKNWIADDKSDLTGYYGMDYFEKIFTASKADNTVFNSLMVHNMGKQDAVQGKDAAKTSWNIMPMLNRHATPPLTLDTLFPMVLNMPVGVTFQFRY